MKHKFGKTVVALLASTVLLAACGSKNEASSPDYELKNVQFPLKEKVNLKFMTASSPLAPADPKDKFLFPTIVKSNRGSY